MSSLPDQLVHMLPLPAGTGEPSRLGSRSLLQYDVAAERLGALVAERRADPSTGRHALALAFLLAGRLPRHLEFGRRPATAIALDPRSDDMLLDLGLRADDTDGALGALQATGLVWSDDAGRVTLAADTLVPLAVEAAERRVLPSLLDVTDLSTRLDAVVPMTTRGSRERKAGAWFVLATVAAAAANREWVALGARAFRSPLSFDASGVTRAISSCVDAQILERHQRPGETTQYRFAAPTSRVTTQSATGSSTPVSAGSDAPACVVEINGATIALARGAELTIDAGMHCRVTKDAVTGITRVTVE